MAKAAANKPLIRIEGNFHFKLVVYLAAILSLLGSVASVNLALNVVAPSLAPVSLHIGKATLPKELEAFKCPQGWLETPGLDPETSLTFRTCTSPDNRYIITARENRPPEAFDTKLGDFVDSEQFYK